MTHHTRTALLIGASGLVGGHLLQLLLDDDAYDHVIAPVRKSLPIHHPKLQVEAVDFNQLDRNRDILRGNDVFCCLGTTIRAAKSQEAFRRVDFTYVLQMASLAFRNGSEQFLLVSAVGANVNSRVFYSRVKGEVEEAVAKLPFKAIRIFRPSFLIGERKKQRLIEKLGVVIMKSFSFTLVGSARKYRAIPALTLANAMIRAAKKPHAGLQVLEYQDIQSLGHHS